MITLDKIIMEIDNLPIEQLEELKENIILRINSKCDNK